MTTFEGIITIQTKDNKENYKTTIYYNQDEKNIKYIEPDKTATIFNYEQNILKRDNDQMSLEFKFCEKEKTINSIIIKDLNKTMELEIYTKKIIKEDNNIIIIYEMNDSEFTYKIEKEK